MYKILVKYYLNDSIKTPFEDFTLGLRNICAGPVLTSCPFMSPWPLQKTPHSPLIIIHLYKVIINAKNNNNKLWPPCIFSHHATLLYVSSPHRWSPCLDSHSSPAQLVPSFSPFLSLCACVLKIVVETRGRIGYQMSKIESSNVVMKCCTHFPYNFF